MYFDHKKFFERYESRYGALGTAQRSGLDQIVSAIEADLKITDLRWAAYMLATVKHECADRWKSIEEYGKGKGRPYGVPVTVAGANGKNYTNTYYGRGYVQLTWKENYQKMSTALGLGEALLIRPEQALDPGIAYKIMSYGMRAGAFTGKKLGDYINTAGCDYKNARRIINGLDQATLIQGYAEKLEAALLESRAPAPPAALRVGEGPRPGPG
jgi:hypothetical protein